MKKGFLLISLLMIALVSNAQTIPSTNFSTPYYCTADNGVISGNAPSEKVKLNTTADPHQIEWSDVSKEYTAVISWQINATSPCYISVSLDLGTVISSNKHIFEVKVLDEDAHELGAVEEGPAYTGDGFTEANQVKALSGKILIPAAGVYTIELRNNRDFCKGSVKNVILSHAGAAPIVDFENPYSCTADDAVLTGTISSSFKLQSETTPHYIMWSDRALAEPSVASWKIVATRSCYAQVSLDLGPVINSNKHIYEIQLLDINGENKGSLSEPGESTESEQVKVLDGYLLIPAAGVYTIELRNNRDYCKGSVKNVILTYDGDAPITDFASPGFTFLAKHATCEGNIEYNTTTSTPYLRYTDNSDPGTATWSVKATRACHVKATMNMVDNSAYSNGNGKHKFTVELLDANSQPITSVSESSEVDESSQTHPRSYDIAGSISIPEAGDYIIRLSNPRPHSRCGVASVTLTYAGGETVTIPNEAIPFADAILGEGATRDANGIHFGNVNAYAKWNATATEGVYSFTVNFTGTNYGKYQLDIKDSENNSIYSDFKGGSGSGQVSFEGIFLPSDGNYTLQLANINSGADGYITSFSAAQDASIFIVDEAETDTSVIAAVAENGHYKAMLKRTFKGGVYNSFCIPVEPSMSELADVFGAGVEIVELESATLDGGVLSLHFAAPTELYAGKPYLIKPVNDVANPTLHSHTIHNYTSNNTVHTDGADFIGTFVKKDIDASENNLYLGTDNKLYFSPNAITIKGLRAYFKVNVPNPSQVIQRARIVVGTQVATDVELVKSEKQQASKLIRDGQLIIIRNGVEYNAAGQIVK